ncbi:MAG: gliding motility lipoprotein GldB [Putridiphycobacter sp.]
MLKNLGYLFLFILFIVGCSSNPLDVDVSEISVDLNFHRFDQKLTQANSIEALKEANQEMFEIGGELYEFYTIEMLLSGSPKDDSIAYYLDAFVKDSMMQIVQENINAKFGNFETYESDITNAFKHLKYHIPHAMLPTDIITYNSTFANGVISSPTQIGIGLEMYLGPENDIISRLPYPEYFKLQMDEQYLLTDIAQSWLTNNVIEDQSGDSFLSHLLYYGKIIYVMEAMMPDLPKHKLLKYSELQYEWAEVSEYDIWQFIVEQEWIYSKDIKLMIRYFKDAPTTVGLDGSPARIGQYLGYKIISAYMQKNEDVSVVDLIAEKNESKILKSYKPKKD